MIQFSFFTLSYIFYPFFDHSSKSTLLDRLYLAKMAWLNAIGVNISISYLTKKGEFLKTDKSNSERPTWFVFGFEVWSTLNFEAGGWHQSFEKKSYKNASNFNQPKQSIGSRGLSSPHCKFTGFSFTFSLTQQNLWRPKKMIKLQ